MATIISTVEQWEALVGHQSKEDYIAGLEAELELFKSLGMEKSVAVISAVLEKERASN
jgi:hypothetical protein